MEEKNSNSDNYFFIEDVSKDDWIGFESYLYSLESSIENKAKFIGLISDYGTGKSTLIDMLKSREENKGNKLVTINLWNCYNDEKENKIDIHRIFLHQLIDKIIKKDKNYYKKKINKNYNIFDIKVKSSWTKSAYLLSVFYILCALDKLEFVNIFSEDLKSFIYILVASLTVLCILIYKPVIAYKKIEDSYRTIDENDTKDLYREIIETYYSSRKNKNKTLIICLEELDRYENADIVLEYLKEFYKFYKEIDKKYKVVFIVSMKSSSQLGKLKQPTDKTDEVDKTSEIDRIKNIYEKTFDFILNLNQINIQDYDSIIYSLIESKREYLEDEIQLPSQKNLKNWRYLYYGKNIKIRDIKHRYNLAMELYLSVKESGIKADFDKCLFIAYLEDEFNELYDKLINDNLIHSMLFDYVKGKKLFKEQEFSKEEREVLLVGLASKFISLDYNYYFYKFPKNKKPYNIYEYELYSAIFYDENSENLDYALKKLKDQKIFEILTKRVNQEFIPMVVFEYPKLITIEYNKEHEVFKKTMTQRFNLLSNFETFYDLISKLKKLNITTYKSIISEYLNYFLPQLKKLGKKEIFILRQELVKELKKDSVVISDLFFKDNYLISSKEINEIGDIKIVMELTDFNIIDGRCLDDYTNILRKQKADKKTIIKLLEVLANNPKISNEAYSKFFYLIKLNEYSFLESEYLKLYQISKSKLALNIIGYYMHFLKYINYYCEKFDNYYLECLNDNLSKETIEEYKNYLNKCGKIYNNSMKFFDNYKEHTVFAFSKVICEKFFENGYYDYYIISTCLREKVYEIEDDKLKILSSNYIKEYELKKEFTCKIGDKMKLFLYNNVDMSKLDSKKLILFNDLPQRLDIIESILNTNDSLFINKYLSKITSISKREILPIYKLIGNYNREYGLKKSAKDNLKKLTNNKECLKELDIRRKLKTI